MSKVDIIELSKIDSFKNHPFLVNNDNSLKELAQSIKDNGLLNPLIVRKKDNDRYEMISGHRRKMALELIGINVAEVYIKELNDDEATVSMVDSNIYREKILPSEKAFAYKMKTDAIKHQGKTTSDPKGPKLTSEIVGAEFGDSSTNVKRYIRLTYLIPELLQLVDDTVLKDKRTALTMGLKPTVELSYLNKEEQKLVYMGITYEDLTPSHSQTIKIRKLSKAKKLDFNLLEEILCQNKGNQNEQISFNKEKIESVLPSDLLKRDKRYIEKYIIEAIIKYNELNKNQKGNIDFDNFNI